MEVAMELKFEVYTKFQKPVAEVFNAIYDPQLLSQYFTTGGASAPMDEGTTVTWAFRGFPGGFPVKIIKTVPNEMIVFDWEIMNSKELSRVTIRFEPLEDGGTLVKIAEQGWQPNQTDLNNSYNNCMGWSHMLCHLKAFIEHGILLRETSY